VRAFKIAAQKIDITAGQVFNIGGGRVIRSLYGMSLEEYWLS